MKVFLALLALLAPWGPRAGAARAGAYPLPPPIHTEVAPGIHLFQTAPYGDVGLDGNSVAIVSDEGVLVFDANGTPAAARAVLAEIRKLTVQPVRYLVLSHWHWDHWYGAEVYAEAFPGLTIVSHEATRRLMDGPAVAFNQPGLDTQLPGHIHAVEERLAGTGSAPPDSGLAARLRRHLEQDRFFLGQKRAVRHTLPTLTFSDSLDIHLGGREIRVLHIDRAITPGDAFLYLPRERLVVSGDLLINPVTFGLFCYPDGWIRSLEWIDSLGAAVLIPGHGAPLREPSLLRATTALLRRERELGRAEQARGHTVAQAVEAVVADAEVRRLRRVIVGTDGQSDDSFKLYLVDWVVRRVYEEAAGALRDTIPSTP
jgi:cyclase